MKIRNGFISNSSTCSFLIYGVCLSKEEISKYLKEDFLNELNEEEKKEMESLSSIKWILENKLNLSVSRADSDEYFFIGKSWSGVRDDQTGFQFKEEIKEIINKAFNVSDSIRFGTFSEAWSDY